jgi:hypothetical protein
MSLRPSSTPSTSWSLTARTYAETPEKHRHAGVAAGMSSEQAASGTEAALRKMQDLGRRGSGSDAFHELVEKAGGTSGAELGEALYHEAQKGAGAGLDALLKHIKKLRDQGKNEGANLVQNIFGLQGQGWSKLIDNIDKFGEATTISAAAAARRRRRAGTHRDRCNRRATHAPHSMVAKSCSPDRARGRQRTARPRQSTRAQRLRHLQS